MFAANRKMQLLLFYCIIIQSCVLRDVESIPTPTELSAESEIPGERVGRSSGDSETTKTSLLGSVNKLFKRLTSIVPHIPTAECMEQTGNLLNHVLRGKRDTTNKQTVADIELNQKGNDRVLRAIDKRDRQEAIALKKAIELTINFLDDLIFGAASVIPKKKKSIAFEDDESTSRNKRFSDYIYTVTANSRKNKKNGHKIRVNNTRRNNTRRNNRRRNNKKRKHK